MKGFAQRSIDIRKCLLSAFELVFAAMFTVVLAVCLTGTKRNIPWYNIAIVTALALAGICGICWGLGRIEELLLKEKRWLFPVFCAVWGIALYIFSCAARNEPAHDYQIVYDAALNLARGKTVDWTYFARWGNNTFLLLLLSLLMKFGLGLGMTDPFFLILLFGVLSVVGSGICIYLLLGWMFGNGKNGGLCVQWMGVLLFVGFIPCWGGTFNFYTDAASLCFGIFAITVARAAMFGMELYSEKVREKPDGENNCVKGKTGSWGYSVLAGALWAMGFLLKATIAISLIAFFLVVLLQKKKFKWKRLLVCVLAGFLMVCGAFQVVKSRLPSAALAEEYAAPVEYWIAIGMSGNGGYGENEELATLILDTRGYAGKKAAAREYIRDHMNMMFDIEHMKAKLRYNFACGNFGLPDYNRYPVTPFYDFFNDYGAYGGYVIMITSGYFYAILILLICGAIKCLTGRLHLKDERLAFYLIVQLTLFGLFIFLMLWEANNRQLYNHMPWLAAACAMSLNNLSKSR